MVWGAKYDLYCPKCRKRAEFFNPCFFGYSVRRWEFPIFLCGDCRTIYIDKQIILQNVEERIKQGGLYAKKTSLSYIYRDVLGNLENFVDTNFVPNLGYKKVRFLKHP